MGGNSDIVPQGFQEVVKLGMITDRLSFSVALVSFRPLIGSPEDEFRMDPVPSESDLIKFVFLCTYSQRDLPVLLRRGGINLSFQGL